MPLEYKAAKHREFIDLKEEDRFFRTPDMFSFISEQWDVVNNHEQRIAELTRILTELKDKISKEEKK